MDITVSVKHHRQPSDDNAIAYHSSSRESKEHTHVPELTIQDKNISNLLLPDVEPIERLRTQRSDSTPRRAFQRAMYKKNSM